MISNEIVVNYEIVYLIEIYNYEIWRSFFHLGSFVQFKKIEFQNLSASNRILGPYMVSNKKVINYKVVDCVEIYNFDVKFVFI